MEQKWDDEKEAMLITLLFDLLPSETWAAIERTSQGTNVRWSDVVSIALAGADWDMIQAAMNTYDNETALAEADDIIRSDTDTTAGA